jgi:pilus assembly protein Flp/PilA
MRRLFKLARDERGATAIEYSLIAALIFLAMVGAVYVFANTTITMWNEVSNKVQSS